MSVCCPRFPYFFIDGLIRYKDPECGENIKKKKLSYHRKMKNETKMLIEDKAKTESSAKFFCKSQNVKLVYCGVMFAR